MRLGEGGGGGGNDSCVCISMHVPGGGVWGYAPPGKFCKLDALRLLLIMRPLLAQSSTKLSLLSVCLHMYDSNLYRRPHAMRVAVDEGSKLLSFQC